MRTLKSSIATLLVIVPLWIGGASPAHSAGTAAAAPGASPAALAQAPVSRGKVVGAPCQPSDGYQPDFSKIEAKAARAAARDPSKLLNLIDFVDASTPLPQEAHQLPLGIPHCVISDDSPNGYLTTNCKTDNDCPSPASCDGTRCRAGCTSDADCLAPATCSSAGRSGLKYCRCDKCVREKNEVDAKPEPRARRPHRQRAKHRE